MRTMYLAAAAVSLIACTVESPDTSVTTQNATTRNRLAANRLAANRLAANRLAANRLAANSLSSTRLVALNETAEILGTHSGRIVYSYIISCAIAEGMTIEKTGVVDQACESDPTDASYTCTVGGLANDAYCTNGTCVFGGGVGVAPNWIDHKLDNKGEGWVSACLFARINAHDTAESISLRGRNDALYVTPEEASAYSAEEGAFYGNVFGDGPIDWNACSGEQNDIATSQLRDCAAENPATPGVTYCGFNYAGACRDFSPSLPSPYACERYTTGYYRDCHAESGNGHWPSSQKYREVITTYVSF